MESDYLESARKQFEYYKLLGDRTFAQVPDEALFVQPDEDSNSIATMVKHLWGNMLSRWTDFLVSDGEKPSRNRDAEFENDLTSREEVLSKWNEGWGCLFSALNGLRPEDLDRIVYIRNQGHTVVEAINRQLAHYPYHVGQIVFLGKMLAREGWTTLSIPKGGSGSFNVEKFSKAQQRAHFTDDVLKEAQMERSQPEMSSEVASLQFRSALPEDAGSCIDLRGKTRQNAFSAEALAAIGITLETWTEGIRTNQSPGHVCLADGAVVGMSFWDRASGEVLVVAVLPEFESLGIGKRLLENVLEDIRQAGFTRSFLGCNSDPASRSHGFYRRLGWTSTGETDALGDEVLELPL
jgi:ribosomal protein S18 acetylase RimI-like enzyme